MCVWSGTPREGRVAATAAGRAEATEAASSREMMDVAILLGRRTMAASTRAAITAPTSGPTTCARARVVISMPGTRARARPILAYFRTTRRPTLMALADSPIRTWAIGSFWDNLRVKLKSIAFGASLSKSRQITLFKSSKPA